MQRIPQTFLLEQRQVQQLQLPSEYYPCPLGAYSCISLKVLIDPKQRMFFLPLSPGVYLAGAPFLFLQEVHLEVWHLQYSLKIYKKQSIPIIKKHNLRAVNNI